MEKDIEFNVNVPADRKIKIEIDLPQDFPCGTAKVVISKAKRRKTKFSKKDPEKQTAADLLSALKKSGVLGMWADRPEAEDSVKFAEELRAKAWGRNKR